jgi:hypothetical protein
MCCRVRVRKKRMAKAKDVESIHEKESLLHLSIHKEIRLRI